MIPAPVGGRPLRQTPTGKDVFTHAIEIWPMPR